MDRKLFTVLCFIVAVVLFVFAAFWGEQIWTPSQLVALGLAFLATGEVARTV